ncbi:hypothetical protein PG985_010462 [Apiospora marii]|uniref:Xylanolytic transcriptional activator regulatory domain-containing protein n=1 Tax=Apiospora marii TaxID=335849 RepID=A0ABR1S0X9_9PEZI
MEATKMASPTTSRHRRQTSQSQSTPRMSRQQPGLACEECRRRVVCVMPTTCPPRGPKKGHLRSLRERIAALESRLEKQNGQASSHHSQSDSEDGSERYPATPPEVFQEPHREFPSDGYHAAPLPATPPQSTVTPPQTGITWASPMIDPSLMFMDENMDTGCYNLQAYTPNLNGLAIPIGLQLTPSVCTDLDQLFFDRIHTFIPMIHKGRYRSWTKQIDKPKKQICLQHAMWTMAASHSSQFQWVRDGLYTETRRLLETLELEPSEHGVLSLEYIQAWLLVAVYEWTINDFHRSLMSAGRDFRSIQLMRLHELDGMASSVTWSGDWVDMESARRTFWVAFTVDCFTAIHVGLSLTFHEQEIRTRLPVPETQFSMGRIDVTMPFLSEIIGRDGYPSLSHADSPTSPWVECILAASLCGRNVTHKQRSRVEQDYGEIVTQDFCHRHQWLDSLVTARIDSLAADYGQDLSFLTDPLLIFAALVAHMNVLLLSEVIDFMPLHTEMSHALRTQQEQKSILAAEQMSKLATAVSHLDRFQSHFFTSIPLSMAANFYVLHLASDEESSRHLQIICGVLQNMTGNNNPAHDPQLPGVNLGCISPTLVSDAQKVPVRHWSGKSSSDQ